MNNSDVNLPGERLEMSRRSRSSKHLCCSPKHKALARKLSVNMGFNNSETEKLEEFPNNIHLGREGGQGSVLKPGCGAGALRGESCLAQPRTPGSRLCTKESRAATFCSQDVITVMPKDEKLIFQ